MFSVYLQPRKMQCHPIPYSVFEEGQGVSRNAYEPNGFSIILGVFEEVTSQSARNNRFYKGLPIAFNILWKIILPRIYLCL